jgi:hypothetical protein
MLIGLKRRAERLAVQQSQQSASLARSGETAVITREALAHAVSRH